MRAWSAAAGERAALAQQAPVGICRFDARGALASVNEAMSTMLGLERRELIGRSYVQLVHPTEVERQRQMLRRLESGAADRLTLEVRCLRADGSTLWCAAYLGAVHDGGGRPDGMLAIMEDISHRREQRERAARIQRSLLPAEVPPLAGYDLAAICQPEDDVGGDFYDWVLARDGHLDLTVADVMGKGIGAALVTATLRAAMRTAPAELGPGERLRRASAAMGLGGEEEGVFVTVFHGRLDLATGELRYVDAGHGYVAIRTAGGDLVSLPERCLPIGVGQEFPEGRVTLAPGDMLVVHSDGLVEREDRTASLSEFAADLDAARDAADAVARLQRTLSGRLADDVTVMALRRAASRPPAA